MRSMRRVERINYYLLRRIELLQSILQDLLCVQAVSAAQLHQGKMGDIVQCFAPPFCVAIAAVNTLGCGAAVDA